MVRCLSCLDFSRILARLVAKALERSLCDCLLFSGGIDTTFILLSSRLFGKELRPFSVTPLESPDYRYITYISEMLNIKVNNLFPQSKKVIESCLDISISKLKTIDPIEIASAISVCIGLLNAKFNGCNCIATGDGGDELFLGYNFLQSLSDNELKVWQDEMAKGKARFNSKDMGKALGIRVEWPLYSDEVREFSLEVPLTCKIKTLRDKTYGKYLMRRFLELNMLERVAWREKIPIVSGSMSLKLLKELSERISEKEIEKLTKLTTIGLPSKEHAYLLKRFLKAGLKPPERCNDPKRRCPVCGSCMDGNHCRFCGTYISKNGKINVYSD